jgi:nickel/cobalt transporter (NicO) family protein
MTDQAFILTTTATAASIAFLHTITGPDHYLPFIMIGRARNWSAFKTAMLTLICGFGHVFSSIILAMICIWFGSMLTEIEWLEGFRGNLAGWLLIAFGFVYMVWGIKWIFKHKEHNHSHIHEDGKLHEHQHAHVTTHAHVHEQDSRRITPWVLFIIFVLGPCEPMIPLLMAPASKGSAFGVVIVAVIFTAVTLLTMLGLVMSSLYGLKMFTFKKLEKYTHALAGGSILCCGLAIQVLGL